MAKVAIRAAEKSGDAALQKEDFLQRGAMGVLKYLDNIAARGQPLPDVRTHYLNVSASARNAIERPAVAEGTVLRRAAEDEFMRERGHTVSDAFAQISRGQRENWLHDRVLPGLPLTERQRQALLLSTETRVGEPEIRGAADLGRAMGITPIGAQALLDKAKDKVSRITHMRGVKPGDAL